MKIIRSDEIENRQFNYLLNFKLWLFNIDAVHIKENISYLTLKNML